MADSHDIKIPNPENVVLRGGCRCGNITYTSTSLPTSMGHCHCLACRKASGSPFQTFASFPIDSLTWTTHTSHGLSIGNTSDESGLSIYEANPWARRGFCGNCGSPVRLHSATRPKEMSIVVGSIDEGSIKGEMMKPTEHIFLEEKAGWFDLPEDGLGRFERFSEGESDKKIKAWLEEHGEEGGKGKGS
ncbi:hypothetical protein VE02_06326 [Pseudogymnoascus sp. 03VT05]|nr:hypothetical protein VE02_06326 [Pseudogymnoascus sp. 03VT05]